MEISEFVSKLTKNSGALLDNDQNKIYWDVYKNLPNREKVFSSPPLTGDDYHTADHLFHWALCSKVIEPIYNKNGIYCGQNIYFYKNY